MAVLPVLAYPKQNAHILKIYLQITQAIDNADIIILASPVYVYHTTGAMKALLDHYGWRWMVHRPEEKMFSKQAVCISTAAGAGMQSTNRDMAHSTFFWGIAKTYKFGIAVMETSWEKVSSKKKQKIEKKLDLLAKKIAKKQGHIKPSIKTFLSCANYRNVVGMKQM